MKRSLMGALLLGCVIHLAVVGTTFSTEWMHYYGGPYGMASGLALELPNGALVVVGATDFTPPHLGDDADAAVVLYGQDGHLIWDLELGGESWDRAISCGLTPDGSILVLGTRGTPFATGEEMPIIQHYAAKVHPFGFVLWEEVTKDYATLQALHPEDCISGVEQPDGWFVVWGAWPAHWNAEDPTIVASWTPLHTTTWVEPEELEIATLSSSGELTNRVLVHGSELSGRVGFGAMAVDGGGYVLVGSIRETASYRDYETLVFEIVDADGTITGSSYPVTRRASESSGYQCWPSNRLVQDDDGGILVLMQDSDPDGISLLKLDAAGKTQWENHFAGVEEVRGLLPCRDGGVLVLGMDYERQCEASDEECASSEWFVAKLSPDRPSD